MKILQILSQHRRDFVAMMKCEFCGHQHKDNSGYDDSYYHQNVIPNQTCKSCGKSTNSGGGSIDKTTTKYPEGYQI